MEGKGSTRFANPAKWEGENLLGRACMRARAVIRQLSELWKLDAVRHEWPALDPSIARMTLLQLSRIPATRAAVYCYATIVSHAAPHVYPSVGAYGAAVAGSLPHHCPMQVAREP